MKKTIITIIFTVNIALQAQDWVEVSSVTNPGVRPSISVASPNDAWIVDGQPNSPKIFRTTDGGATWLDVQTSGISKELYCVWAMSQNVVFVGEGEVSGGAKLLKTTDAGETWNVIYTTPPNRGFFNGLAFTKANGNVFGLAIAERIYRSTNFGNNWIELNAGVNGVSNAQNSLTIVDNIFYGFGLNNGAARVRLTTDNSTTWNTYSLSVSGNYTSAIAFHSNKGLGLAATSTSPPMVSRTSDGGLTWTSVNIGAGVTGTCYLNWIPNTPVVYILGSNGGIKRSTDNGLTWTLTPTPGVTNLKHFDFYHTGMIVYGYAVSSDGNVIKLVDTLNILTGINNNQIPGNYSLDQNYPNPFNPSTSINYSIAAAGFVKLSVYDALGREIDVLVNEVKHPGNYESVWDASGFNSGVYFYKLQSGEFTQTKKMILIK
jgi:photosystem II stability/assembly factor-like uncharacterized protein